MSIIDDLNKLKPGDRMVYLIEDTGWSGLMKYRELYKWCQEAQKRGTRAIASHRGTKGLL